MEKVAKTGSIDKPEHYKAPTSATGPAWGASTSVWANRPDPRREQQLADGQPFLIALGKAVDAKKKSEKQ
jgi:hypothetical protein